MPQRLYDLVLEEISLVDSPANEGARVVFWKRDGGFPNMPMKPPPGLSSEELKRWMTMTDAERKQFMAGRLAKAVKMVRLLKGGDAEVKDDDPAVVAAMDLVSGPEVPKEPNKETEGVDVNRTDPLKVDPSKPDPVVRETPKVDDPEVKKALKAKDDEIAALTKRLGTLEETVTKSSGLEERLAKSEGVIAGFKQRETIAKLSAELTDAGVINPEEAAKLIESLPEAAAKSVKERMLSDAAVLKTANLFTAIGSTGSPSTSGSAESELEEKAKKMAGEKNIPYENAFSEIWKSDNVIRKKVEDERAIAKRRAN